MPGAGAKESLGEALISSSNQAPRVRYLRRVHHKRVLGDYKFEKERPLCRISPNSAPLCLCTARKFLQGNCVMGFKHLVNGGVFWLLRKWSPRVFGFLAAFQLVAHIVCCERLIRHAMAHRRFRLDAKHAWLCAWFGLHIVFCLRGLVSMWWRSD